MKNSRATSNWIDQSLNQVESGYLSAKPRQVSGFADSGLRNLDLGRNRDGLIYVPEIKNLSNPASLILMFHDAGENAAQTLPYMRQWADTFGFILLAPDSRGRTWDLILGDFGPDVTFINRALSQTFERYPIDQDKIAISGIFDGATYALSLGLSNGDLFNYILAFSPSFAAPAFTLGSPRIFIAQGAHAPVTPVHQRGRRISTDLAKSGHEVSYHEYAGGYSLPPGILEEALVWMTGNSAGHLTFRKPDSERKLKTSHSTV